jgi:hypothetical protein
MEADNSARIADALEKRNRPLDGCERFRLVEYSDDVVVQYFRGDFRMFLLVDAREKRHTQSTQLPGLPADTPQVSQAGENSSAQGVIVVGR